MIPAKVQLNLAFLPAEDRLLLRIASGAPGSMAEYRLLLTRRFVRLFWKALDQVLECCSLADPCISPEGKKTLMQFQQSAALSETDFSTPYTSERVTAPLGPNPVLIHKFQVRQGPEGSQVISLETTAGRTIRITLSLRLIHSLRKLLADMVAEACWDLPCDLMPEDTAVVAETLRSIN